MVRQSARPEPTATSHAEGANFSEPHSKLQRWNNSVPLRRQLSLLCSGCTLDRRIVEVRHNGAVRSGVPNVVKRTAIMAEAGEFPLKLDARRGRQELQWTTKYGHRPLVTEVRRLHQEAC